MIGPLPIWPLDLPDDDEHWLIDESDLDVILAWWSQLLDV